MLTVLYATTQLQCHELSEIGSAVRGAKVGLPTVELRMPSSAVPQHRTESNMDESIYITRSRER